jgi:hypothetical protein
MLHSVISPWVVRRVQVNEIVAQQQNMSKELDVILEAYLAIHPK